jgi:DNA ligase (NAD+)
MAGRVEVRGEIVCPKAKLPELGYKDCRTAASALTNQMVPTSEVSQLVFMAWQMDSDYQPFGTETASIDVAQEQGFMTTDRKGCWGEKVLQLLDEFEAKREAYLYPTDGVVIKIDHKPLADSMGCTEHHPKGNIAYKFTANKALTKVLRIEVKVAESGRRTPVAYLQPVMIMGREVSKASLYSERKMEELGVTEGCTVEVGLSNDVTPKVYRVLYDSNHATEGGLLPTENNLQANPEDATPAAAGDTNTETNIITDQGVASSDAREPIFKEEQEEPAANKLMRSAGYLVAASVAIIIVYQTGLIIPLGLIGLGASGLLR